MARPKRNRIVAHHPEVCYFKPRGIPMLDLEENCLTIDERESIRLADLLELSYEEAGRMMGVSRATFGRIVQQARKVIADAIINGKAIKIEGGNYTIVSEPRIFLCSACDHRWEEQPGTGRPASCPMCNAEEFARVRDKSP